MADVAPVAAAIPARKPQTNVGHISGRISSFRTINTQQGKLHLTVLKLAAPTEYDHPGTVELRSSFRLGERGDEWSGQVKLGGMPNTYPVTDRDTGDKVQVVSARNEYTVID